MKPKMKKLFFIILISIMTFSFLISSTNINVKAVNQEKITIVHTNDVHGNVDVEPYVKGLADQLRTNGENVIIASAGDAFAGTSFASLSNGLDVARVMNAVGYEMMTLGNHEYAMKYNVLKDIVDASNFPILGANAEERLKTEIPKVKDYVIKEMNGIKIAFLGLTTSYHTEGNTHGNKTVEIAEQLKIQATNEGAEIFIALTHLGVTDPNPTMRSTYLADHCPWLTAIIDAHCHTVHQNGLLHNGVLISETGEYGNNIGVTEIYLEDGTVTNVMAKVIPIKGHEIECGITPDTNVQQIIDEVNTKNNAYLSSL